MATTTSAAKKKFYTTKPTSFDKSSGHWPAPAAVVQAKAAIAGTAVNAVEPKDILWYRYRRRGPCVIVRGPSDQASDD
jgi:hypothetical protein